MRLIDLLHNVAMLEKTCHATGFAMLGKGWNSRQHFFLNKETTIV
jgi:hypothetical protein